MSITQLAVQKRSILSFNEPISKLPRAGGRTRDLPQASRLSNVIARFTCEPVPVKAMSITDLELLAIPAATNFAQPCMYIIE